jgi:hypothetical protein
VSGLWALRPGVVELVAGEDFGLVALRSSRAQGPPGPHNVIAVVEWFIVSGDDRRGLVGGLVRSAKSVRWTEPDKQTSAVRAQRKKQPASTHRNAIAGKRRDQGARAQSLRLQPN